MTPAVTQVKRVKVGLSKQVNLSHATARRAYRVGANGWLDADDTVKNAKDLKAIPSGSVVLLRISPKSAEAEDAIYKVVIGSGAPAVSKLEGGDGSPEIGWVDGKLTVYAGATYGAVWMKPAEAAKLPVDVLGYSFKLDWNSFAPSPADADAGRFIVRRAIRCEFRFTWFDGSDAAGALINLHTGTRTVVTFVEDDGSCTGLIPVPDGPTSIGLRTANSVKDIWTRPFNLVL